MTRRPLYPGERTVMMSFCLSERQRDKVRAFGGSEWLRARIDADDLPAEQVAQVAEEARRFRELCELHPELKRARD